MTSTPEQVIAKIREAVYASKDMPLNSADRLRVTVDDPYLFSDYISEDAEWAIESLEALLSYIKAAEAERDLRRARAALQSAAGTPAPPPPQTHVAGDSQPRYTTKRLHDEIAKARAYGMELAASMCIERAAEYDASFEETKYKTETLAAGAALVAIAGKIREKIASQPPQQHVVGSDRTTIELKMTAFADAAPQRDEFNGEQTILTYTDRVGTWDLAFFESGEEFPERWLGDTHWIDITKMWPGVIAQVASFKAEPAEHVQGEDGEQFVKDAIRSAYDRGYNDARVPLNLPRDNAPGYRGREMSEEIATDALARLRRLPSPEANKDGYVPGTWRCPKCNFRLLQSNLNASDGTVTARDTPGDKCPNCDGPLWRVTWKDEAEENITIAENQIERAVKAERKLDRARTALKSAINHIEHMAAWFSNKGTGYSFEALGEDMPGIKAALAATATEGSDNG